MKRCHWANLNNPLYVKYHDTEWGRPNHDDRYLFEMLVLESFQAGLSWECILNKRAAFRQAFDNFDYRRIAQYDVSKVMGLLQNPGIVRHRAKIMAAITNAQVFITIQQEYGSFDHYIWHFTNGQQISNHDNTIKTTTPLSDQISHDLQTRGMKFVGSTIIYAYLQAIGVVNDHEPECDWHF